MATSDKKKRTLGYKVSNWFGTSGNNGAMQQQQEAFMQRKNLTLQRNRTPHLNAPASGQRAEFAQQMLNGSSSSDDGDGDDTYGRYKGLPCDEDKLIFDRKAGIKAYIAVFEADKRLRQQRHKRGQYGGWFEDEKDAHQRNVPKLNTVKRSNGKAPRRLRRNETLVAAQLQSLPIFFPWFIYGMTMIQLIVILGLGSHAYTKGRFAPIGLETRTSECTEDASGVQCPLMFNSTRDTNAIKTTAVNLWIGPEASYLVSMGAKYTPCMRDDIKIKSRLARERHLQCGFDPVDTDQQKNLCDTDIDGYSCCKLSNQRSGMTDKETCQSIPGSEWQQDLQGGNVACDEEAGLLITLRPCCIGLDSTCQMLTHDACAFYNGVWHDEARVCSELMCLQDVCGMPYASALEVEETLMNEPKMPNQWYRFFLAVFMHVGGIHYVLNMCIQIYAGKQIERQAGFLRTMLIYWISGVGGNIISGIFVPYQVEAGPSGAVYGLLGVLIVELFQAWPIVPRPLLELTKLLVLIGLALFIGTFPYVDNFSHLGGFAFGVVSAVLFLPYITFGKWDYARKKVLVIISAPLILCMFIVAIVLFYEVQNTEFCEWCGQINCVEWTSMVECSEA